MSYLRSAAVVLVSAGLIGVVAGIGSLATTPEGRSTLSAGTRNMAVAAGFTRRRPPRPGDVWRGCDDVRAAGTAPIYAGEPGYRAEMDGDGDGIACEPIQ